MRESKSRKFSQSIDLFVKIKSYSPKQDGEINIITELPNMNKKSNICAIVGPELLEDAKKSCEKVLTDKDLEKLDIKSGKKLAREFDFFVAQVQLMPKLAKNLGRILGPLGKMPNPKRGQVLSPKSDILDVAKRLKNSTKLSTKKQNAIATKIGTEDMKDEEILANIKAVIEAIEHNIPTEHATIDTLTLKTSMGEPIKIR